MSDPLETVLAKLDRKQRMETLNKRLAELDKLKGTGYWDSSYDNLWHALYKRLLELENL